MLLLAGAPDDPNLVRLASAARSQGLPCRWAAIDRRRPPSVSLDPSRGRLFLDGEPLVCSAAFLRPDAFLLHAQPSAEEEARASTWFSTLWAWIAGAQDIRTVNRGMAWAAVNKPLALRLAAQCGLAIPATRVTNDLAHIRARGRGDWAVKPVDGGSYCRSWLELAAAHPETAALQPAIFQERLEYPELRIFVVGEQLFTYEIRSALIDYRRDPRADVRPAPGPPREIAAGLLALARKLGLDFAAADFKLSPEQARFVFLEINTSPMFAGFDALDGGRLSRALLEELVAGKPVGSAPAVLEEFSRSSG